MLSVLYVIGGLIVCAIGALLSATRLQRAARAHRRSEALASSMSEGWDGWFFHGFASMTTGARRIVTVLELVGWAALGLGLVSLGMRLG